MTYYTVPTVANVEPPDLKPDQYATYLFALDSKTGKEKWRFQTPSGQGIEAPVISDGMLYMGSNRDGSLRALDLNTGTEKWKFQINGTVLSLAVGDGTVYVSNYPSSSGTFVYAVDSLSGQQRWKFETPGGSSNLKLSGDTLYVGSIRATLIAIDVRTGAEKWRFSGSAEEMLPPVINRGFVATNEYMGDLFVLDEKTGKQIWKKQQMQILKLEDGVLLVVPGQTGEDSDILTVPSTLSGMDLSTGELKWKIDFNQGSTISIPLVSKGIAYSNTIDGLNYAVRIPTLKSGQLCVEVIDNHIMEYFKKRQGSSEYQDSGGYPTPTGYLMIIDVDSGKSLWKQQFTP